MSGICGVLSLSGQRVEPSVMDSMLSGAGYLGDTWHVWTNGAGLILGYQYDDSHPYHNQQQLFHQQDGIVVLSDATIDDRENLVSGLVKDGLLSTTQPADSEIFHAAYRKWGRDCCHHVLGDHVVAIWDSNIKELVVIRDVIGRRVAFYFFDGRFFVFATTIKQLHASLLAPKNIDELAIAAYLTNRPNNYLVGNTFFQGIARLKPAYLVSVKEKKLAIRNYSTFDTSRSIRYKDDREYADQLYSLMDTCFNDQLKSHSKAGLLVSGGMDSTSIAQVLSRQRSASFELYNAKYPGLSEVDESAYAEELARRCNLKLNSVDAMQHLPFVSGMDLVSDLDEPPPYYDHNLWAHVFGLIKSAGANTVIGGFSGDQLFVVHPEMVLDYLKQGAICKALSAYRSLLKYYSMIVFKFPYLRFLAGTAIPYPLRLQRRKYFEQKQAVLQSGFYLSVKSHPGWFQPVKHDYGFASFHQNKRVYYLTTGASIFFGFITDLARSYSLELRDPFSDRRLVEFMLAVPSEQCFSHEKIKTKFILRNAMHDRLPNSILNRSSKTDFRLPLNLGLSEWLNSNYLSTVKMNLVKNGFVEPGYLQQQLIRAKNHPNTGNPYDVDIRPLSRILYLEYWIKSNYL